MIRDILAAMQELYDSEINCQISSFWDTGYTAKLGDEMNGFVDSRGFETIEDAMNWLVHRAIEIYPDSEYAHNRKAK